MTINTSLLIVAPSLEMFFIDKTLGTPLASGLVYFYSQTNTSVLKNIYDQNGNALPNPVVLSSVGTFQDGSGNNIIPYYYPYDANGNEELYYIKVYSSLDGITPATLQFTRMNWPPPAFEGTSNIITNIPTYLNEIPNGQFVTHNNGKVWGGLITGQVVNNATGVYNIAPGGWTFERPSGSSATDIITFSRFNSSIGNPTGNPRYALNVNCTDNSMADSYKRICVKFLDVNKFSATSAEDDNDYTFSFTASSAGGNIPVTLYALQNFGTGGSPQNPFPLPVAPISIAPGYAIYNSSFEFPTSTGFTIGTFDDDSIQVAIYLPTSSTFNLSFTDFILTYGNVKITGFLDETDADMLTRGVAGFMPLPDPNGFNAYLPVILTPTGFGYDQSIVGKVFASSQPTVGIGELPCDGSSYITSAYSTDGIPYARLFAKYFNNGNTNNVPIYGTGANFVTAYISTAVSNLILLNTNEAGSQTAPVDSGGGTATGFTFTKVVTGFATISMTGYTNGSTTSWFLGDVAGAAAGAPVDVSTGFSITPVRNMGGTYQEINIITVASSSISGGAYFTFSNTTTTYNMWFKVAGSGSSPGGNAIEVDVPATLSATDIASIISNAASGNQIYSITTVAASSLTGGDYFSFTSNSVTYNVWYTKAGVGTAPAGSNLIQVQLVGAETAAQVAMLTQAAINSYQFAVPDYQGLVFRGTDVNGSPIWDIDQATRFSTNNVLGTGLGSLEVDTYTSHLHTTSTTTYFNTPSNTGSAAAIACNQALSRASTIANAVVVNMSPAGGSETRPVNIYVNYVVKY